MSNRSECRYIWLNRIEYREAWDLQRQMMEERAQDAIPDTLLLLEHPPVFTTGRRGPGNHLRIPEDALGAPLIETDRGGDITFHGPGQIVGYPIIELKSASLGVADYVRALEETMIRTLASFEINSVREPGLTGVWTRNEKIAAIGVRVSHPLRNSSAWVTSHGFALNVDVDLSWFSRVVPCGIADRGVTSMAKLLESPPSLQEVADRLAACFGDVFDRHMLVTELSLRG